MSHPGGLSQYQSLVGSETQAPGNPKATILVVDDEPAVLRILVMRLQLAGYRVICAEDGEEAVDIFHR